MSKKIKTKKGWIAGLSIVGVLGVLTAAVAVVTKGFKNWGFVERILTGGETVMKLKVSALEEGVVTLTNGAEHEAVTIHGEVTEGALSENGKTLTLGEAEEDAAMTKEEFETMVGELNIGESSIAYLEEQVLNEDELCKVSTLTIPLLVEKDGDAAPLNAMVVPWFDAIRVNYRLPGQRMILSANVGVEKVNTKYAKEVNVTKAQREDINIFGTTAVETLSDNTLIFATASLGGAADNTVTIESIDLIKTVRGHANEYCWIYQQ